MTVCVGRTLLVTVPLCRASSHGMMMSRLISLLILLVLAATGCVTARHGSTLTSGQALALAQAELPSPDLGQAYGVQFQNGIWLVCLFSASFVDDGPNGIIVAKVRDADGKVEVMKRRPPAMESVPVPVVTNNYWTAPVVPGRNRI